jgi:hypothetical protein
MQFDEGVGEESEVLPGLTAGGSIALHEVTQEILHHPHATYTLSSAKASP